MTLPVYRCEVLQFALFRVIVFAGFSGWVLLADDGLQRSTWTNRLCRADVVIWEFAP